MQRKTVKRVTKSATSLYKDRYTFKYLSIEQTTTKKRKKSRKQNIKKKFSKNKKQFE